MHAASRGAAAEHRHRQRQQAAPVSAALPTTVPAAMCLRTSLSATVPSVVQGKRSVHPVVPDHVPADMPTSATTATTAAATSSTETTADRMRRSVRCKLWFLKGPVAVIQTYKRCV